MQQITYAEFEKVEVRTGTILSATISDTAKKPAYVLQIDFGSETGIRRSSAQITTYYTTAQLVGLQVVAVVNFPPKQIGKVMSECLVLGVVHADGSVVLLQTERTVANGLRIA
ncbi:MAG: tRNA-binding protein [Flavobacteriales bacterium]